MMQHLDLIGFWFYAVWVCGVCFLLVLWGHERRITRLERKSKEDDL